MWHETLLKWNTFPVRRIEEIKLIHWLSTGMFSGNK